jgi:hypothetical protein
VPGTWYNLYCGLVVKRLINLKIIGFVDLKIIRVERIPCLLSSMNNIKPTQINYFDQEDSAALR